MSSATDSELEFTPLHFVAGTLAAVVGIIHLGLGLENWARYAYFGIYWPPDIRWPLFVLSGGAIFVGILAVASGVRRRPWYLAGMALQVVYVVGYFAWHLGGHRPLFVLGPATEHSLPILELLIAHVVDATWYATVALVAEVALFGLLGYLVIAESD